MFDVDRLAQFFRYGAIGASFGFLCLSYFLLRKEQHTLDKNGSRHPARGMMIGTIVGFSLISLIFFLVGVLSEVILRNSASIIQIAFSESLKNSSVGIKLNEWGFEPEKSAVNFNFVEDNFDPTRYISATERSSYEVIVGLRRHSSASPTQETYPIIFNGFPVGTSTPKYFILKSQEKMALGENCIDIAVFGVPKLELQNIPARKSFSPATYKGTKLFSYVYAGPKC